MTTTQGAKGNKLVGGAISEAVVASSPTVLRRNQGGGLIGLQQIFTPWEAARFIGQVVGTRNPVLDLTAGNGQLLEPHEAALRFGIEIDPDQVKAAKDSQAPDSRAYHALTGDTTLLFPLIRRLGILFTTVVLNPPFSLDWRVSGLGEGSSTQLAVKMGLALLVKNGMLAFITGADRFERELAGDVEIAKRLVAVVTVEKLFKGVDHRCVIVFLKNGELTPRAAAVPAFRETVHDPDHLDYAMSSRIREVMTKRFGYSNPEAGSAPSAEMWSAIQEEYEERQADVEKGDERFLIRLDGRRMRVRLNAFTKVILARQDHGLISWLQGFDRQPPNYFALQEKQWRQLLAVSEKLGREQVGTERAKIDPELVKKVEAAIVRARASAVPLYRVNEVQRLGFLDSLDEILCREDDPKRGFVAGKKYPINCTTVTKEATETRQVVGADDDKMKEVIVQRKAMKIWINNQAFEESAEHLQYLLKHFDVPDPGDLETVLPERVAYWRGVVRRVEKEIQGKLKDFSYFDFQVEDLARALTKQEQDGGGSVLGWEQGLGKSLGESSYVRALELAGRSPDECALFIMPQDLAKQFTGEVERFFGRKVVLMGRLGRDSTGPEDEGGFPAAMKRFENGSWKRLGKREVEKSAPNEVTACQLVEMVRARRAYLSRKRAAEREGKAFNEPEVPGVWAVTWYEALAITGRVEKMLPVRTIGHQLVYTTKDQNQVERVVPEAEIRRHPRQLLKQRRVPLHSNEYCPACRADEDDGWNRRTCSSKMMGDSPLRTRRRLTLGVAYRKRQATNKLPSRWLGRRRCGHVDVQLRRKPAYSHLLNHVFRVVCVDEATKIKGDDSLISRAVMGFRPEYRLLCTGTPVDDYVIDLFWLLWWAIGDSTPRFPYAYRGGKDKFIGDFGVVEYQLDDEGEKGRPKVLPEASNLPRLWRLLCSSILRRRMDEVGCVVGESGEWTCKGCKANHTVNVKGPDGRYQKPNRLVCSSCSKVYAALVPLTFRVVDVPWGVKQRKLFGHWLDGEKFARYFQAKHPESNLGSKLIQRMAACLGQFALLEYAGTFPTAIPDDAKVVSGISPWTPAMLQLLTDAEKIIRAGGRVLIGSCLVSVGPWVAERLRERGLNVEHISEPDGKGKVKTFGPKVRATIIAKVRAGDAQGLAVGVEAINLGHNLDMMTDVLLIGLPWRYATLVQFLARARRLSSRLPVTAHLYIPKGSLAAKKWETQRRKGDAADLVLDGKIMGRRERGMDMVQLLRELQEQGARFDGTEVPEEQVYELWKKGEAPEPVRIRKAVVQVKEPEVQPAAAATEGGRVRKRRSSVLNGELFGEYKPRFRTFYMDPGWEEHGGGGRGAQLKYTTMPTDKMPGLIRSTGLFCPYPDSHLYMWVTNTFLEHGLWLMKALGFRYVTNFAWPKDQMGIGQYARGKHELLFFGVHGFGMSPSVMTDALDIHTLIESDPPGRRIHSKKPLTTYEKIMARSKGPYVEFFSRNAPWTDEWTVWGNESRPNDPPMKQVLLAAAG